MHIDRVRINASLPVSVFFFIALFLYLWLRINPSFYVLEQSIAFQGTLRFLLEYLSYPGGIVDYCSAVLSVFFVYPVVGAMVITTLLLLIAYATYQLLQLVFGVRKWQTAYLLPVILCAALHSNYDHPLSVTISLTITLALFVFYANHRFRRTFTRVAFYLVLAAGLYYCAGGVLLLFSLLCMLLEMIMYRRWVVGLFYGTVAAIIPYLSKACLFLVSTHDAYLNHLPFGDLGYTIPILPYALYAFFPGLFFILLAGKLLRKIDFLTAIHARMFTSGTRTKAFVSGVSLIAIMIVTFMFSFHRSDNAALSFCSMTLKSQWTDILKKAGENPAYSTLPTKFAVAQALFYRGLLPVDLFSFPQYPGVRGIFLCEDETSSNTKLESFSYFYRGELALKLGLVNSAQHWFYEALATQDAKADVVKRLCQVHALKGDFQAARTCLSMLKTMPMQRKWALQFGNRLENGSFVAADTELAAIQKSMPEADFLLADSRQPYLDCEEALRQHPNNRMTFEYCMASCLLLRNPRKIASLAGYLDTLGYAAIPLLYEQALVMLKAGNYPLPSVAVDRISQKTLDDFLVVDDLLYQSRGDLNLAKNALHEKFGATYWYYHFYSRPDLMGEP